MVERGIDLDVSRIEIHGMFRRTAGMLMKTLQHQSEVGQIEVMQTPQGEIRKHCRAVCPRTAGELGRSLNRWGQFLGLQDSPAEVTQHTLIQLSAPSDGAAFGEKWSQPPVEIEATGPTAQLPPAEASQSLNEGLLTKQFEANQSAA